MKKFITLMVAFVAFAAVVATIAYWMSYFMAAKGEKLHFSVKDILPKKKDSTSEEPQPSSDDAPSCSCNNAVCAVDMCMPY